MSRLSDELSALTDERRQYVKDRLGELLDLQAELLGEPTGVRPEPRHSLSADQVTAEADSKLAAKQPELWEDDPSRTVESAGSTLWEVKRAVHSEATEENPTESAASYLYTSHLAPSDHWALLAPGSWSRQKSAQIWRAATDSATNSPATYPTQLAAIEAARKSVLAAQQAADPEVEAAAVAKAVDALTVAKVHENHAILVVGSAVYDTHNPSELSALLHRVHIENIDKLELSAIFEDRFNEGDQ